jgi:molybdate transport system permease protein
MGTPIDLNPFWLSIRVATLSTLIVVAVGTPASLLLARHRFPGRGLVAGLLLAPMVLPPTVLGFLLLEFLGRRGLLGSWLESTLGLVVVFHWTGAVIASAVTALPLFVMPARAAFETVDPDLEDAARLLGRTERSVFLSVTLPLAWPGLAAGTVLAFVRAFGDFGATLMVAGDLPGRTRTLSIAIYNASMAGDTRQAALLGAIALAIATTGLALVQEISRRRLPTRLTPRSGQP